jgi:Protein of unknown function (DUF3014)
VNNAMVDPYTNPPQAADYELVRPEDPGGPPAPRRNVGLWIAGAVLLCAAAVAAYFVFRGGHTTPALDARAGAAAPQSRSVHPLGGVPEAVDVPPLDQTDPLVRSLVARLSSHPRVADWLATNGLIRNFAVVVINIAEGSTPAVHLRVFRPAAPFAVVTHGDGLYIDPRSYARYDGVAAAVASIDAPGAARIYATLKPRIEEAHRELGAPDGTFDQSLEKAIVTLLETPVLDEPVRVEPRGVGYGFADPKLEGLTAAQKQLLRMGPANVRLVQTSLRTIALELGIPPDRLPPVRR